MLLLRLEQPLLQQQEGRLPRDLRINDSQLDERAFGFNLDVALHTVALKQQGPRPILRRPQAA